MFVPRIDLQRGELDMLRVYDEADLESFPSGKWGIREPAIEKNGQRRTNGHFGHFFIISRVLIFHFIQLSTWKRLLWI